MLTRRKVILLSILALVVLGNVPQANVVLINDTGLRIARIEIDDRRFETDQFEQNRLFISVTPKVHHLKLVFRGGAKIEWLDFDFKGIHEIFFKRTGNRIDAIPE